MTDDDDDVPEDLSGEDFVKYVNQKKQERAEKGKEEEKKPATQEIPKRHLERQALNRKLRDEQKAKAEEKEEEKEEEEEKSFSERHPNIAKVGKIIKDVGAGVKKELKQIADNADKIKKSEKSKQPNHEEEEEEEEEETPPPKKLKSKKSKKPNYEDEEDEEEHEKRPTGSKLFLSDYKKAYSGESFGSGIYSAKVPITHRNPITHRKLSGEEQPAEEPPRRITRQPAPQKRTSPAPMPTIFTMGDYNPVKTSNTLPGGMSMFKGPLPKIRVPSMNKHKQSMDKMPSINIPTVGGSTLLMGSGLRTTKPASGKKPTINNVPTINIPRVGEMSFMGNGLGINNLTSMKNKSKGTGLGIPSDNLAFNFLSGTQKKKGK